jgi:hypothetical protein
LARAHFESGSLLDGEKRKAEKAVKRLNLQKATILAGLVLGLGVSAPATTNLLNMPVTFPLLSYDNGGTTSYDANTDAFRVDAFPIAIRVNAASPPRFITPPVGAAEFFTISIVVDGAGNLVGGGGGDDLSIFGSVDLNGDTIVDAAGSLLTGRVTGFGFQNNGTTDLFDFTFVVTGGALAQFFAPNVAVGLQSERSTFANSFQVSFGGGAKGTLGSTIPEPASLVLFGAGVLGLGAIGRKRG